MEEPKKGTIVRLVGNSWHESVAGKRGRWDGILTRHKHSRISLIDTDAYAGAYPPTHPLFGTDFEIDVRQIITNFYEDNT